MVNAISKLSKLTTDNNIVKIMQGQVLLSPNFDRLPTLPRYATAFSLAFAREAVNFSALKIKKRAQINIADFHPIK